MNEQKHVILYTDGACIGNPGSGGYGVLLKYKDKRRELTGGYRLTTNNRMELMAAIIGLRALKEKCKVTLYSDSEYLVKAMSKGWPEKWRANGWRRGKKQKALNPDLWEELLRLCELHDVEFKWVKGHEGNAENERCDHLAMWAAQEPNLPVDFIYEKTSSSNFASK